MPRPSKTDLELGYVRDFWQEVIDIEREHKSVVTLRITPANSRGVLVFRLEAYAVNEIEDDSPRKDSIQRGWPSASNTSLAGFMWSLARRLNDQMSNR